MAQVILTRTLRTCLKEEWKLSFLKKKIIPCFVDEIVQRMGCALTIQLHRLTLFRCIKEKTLLVAVWRKLQTASLAIWLNFSRSHKISMPYFDWLLYIFNKMWHYHTVNINCLKQISFSLKIRKNGQNINKFQIQEKNMTHLKDISYGWNEYWMVT